MRALSLIVLCLLAVSSMAQVDIRDVAFYADVMVNAQEDEHRKKANQQLLPLVEKYLSQADADLEAFKLVKWISQQQLTGSDYTIYTWQVKESEESYKTYGFVKKAGGDLVPLTSTVPTADSRYEVTGPDGWIGALYYKVLPTMVDGEQAWLLFGYDGHSAFDRRKILDVITFDDNGKPEFGAELFKRETGGPRADITTRIILTYSKDSNVILNYNDAMDILIHDHLINRMGRIPGQGETWLADGSYEGYKWDGQHWVYDEKVFEQVTAEGEYPRPSPVLDLRKEGRGK